MASKLSYSRTTADKLSVKGELSQDGSYIAYEDENKDIQEINMEDLLKPFLGKYVELNIQIKENKELDIMADPSEEA